MPIRLLVVAICAAVVLALGCENRTQLPVGPSVSDQNNALSGTVTGGALRFAAAAEHGKSITLFDACDPDTFNAPPPDGVGPGTCSRQGGITFANFIAELMNHHSVGAWHMAPGQATIKLGDTLSALNQGGETHTFTEVDEFGGGISPELNAILGLTRVQECDPRTLQFLPPGASFHEETDEVGVEKYQCCIHPWMRAEIHIVQR